MNKDIKWGSIEIKGLEDGNFDKFSIKQLTAIENAAIATKLNIENGHYEKFKYSSLGKKRTEETKSKLSKASKGRKLSDEAKNKIREKATGRVSKLRGKKRTDEEKLKMSENRKGKGLGRVITDEHKEKLKESLRTKFICEICNREIGGMANFIKHNKLKHNK